MKHQLFRDKFLFALLLFGVSQYGSGAICALADTGHDSGGSVNPSPPQDAIHSDAHARQVSDSANAEFDYARTRESAARQQKKLLDELAKLPPSQLHELRDQTLRVVERQLAALDQYDTAQSLQTDGRDVELVQAADFVGYENLLSEVIGASDHLVTLRSLLQERLNELELAIDAASRAESSRRRLQESSRTVNTESARVAEAECDLARAVQLLKQIEFRTLKKEQEQLVKRSELLRRAALKIAPQIRLSDTTLRETLDALENYRKALESNKENPDLQQITRMSRVIEQWQRRAKVLNNLASRDQMRSWLDDTRRELAILDSASQTANLLQVQARKQLIALEVSDEKPSPQSDGNGDPKKQLEDRLNSLGEELLNIDAARSLTLRLQIDLQSHVGETTFGDRLRNLRSDLYGIWSYELFTTSDDRPITVKKVIVGILLILFGTFLSRRLSRFCSRHLFPRVGIRHGAAAAFESLLFYALAVACTLIALYIVSVPLTVFTVLGGALAIGVGFGSQTLVSNFISGLIMLIEQPIRPGDLLEISGHQGQVKRIGARSTIILTKENVDVVVPNSEILQKSVVNWTLADKKVKITIAVGVAYDSNVETVDLCMMTAAQLHPKVLTAPVPGVVLKGFGESALEFELHVWGEIHSFSDLDHIQSDIRRLILDQFKSHGIVIPFPQHDVHIRPN